MADSWKDKLSPQHTAIFTLAGVMIVISLVQSIKAPGDSEESQAFATSRRGSMYQNPKMAWYEKIFCRGYQRSANCAFTFYHPMREKLESEGARIKEKAAPNGVMLYRGKLRGQRDVISGKIHLGK